MVCYIFGNLYPVIISHFKNIIGNAQFFDVQFTDIVLEHYSVPLLTATQNTVFYFENSSFSFNVGSLLCDFSESSIQVRLLSIFM